MAGAICLAAGHVRRGVLSARPSSHAHPHTDTDPAAPPSLAETDPRSPPSLAETEPGSPPSLAETDLRYPFLGIFRFWSSPSWRKKILGLRSLWRKQILVAHSSGNRPLGSPTRRKQILDLRPLWRKQILVIHTSGNRSWFSYSGRKQILAHSPLWGKQILVTIPRETNPGSLIPRGHKS